MKNVLFASLLVLCSATLHAADTAYNALRVIGKQHGPDSLNRVVEVRGRSGVPVPAVWKIVLEEPRARGGAREFEIQRGQVIAERTPTARALGTAMNFNQLNLDSEGAFTIANQQAQKAGVAFDRVDYSLKSGSNGGAPIWELTLLSGRDGSVGTVQIAADSGSVLHQEGFVQRTPPPSPKSQGGRDRTVVEEDRDFVTEPGQRREEVVEEQHERIHNVPSFFRRVRQHFERRGYQIKNFFTGE